MFGLGEIIVIVVAGAWVFGPQDLPRITRMVGNLTGRAMGTLYRARAQLFQFAEQTEITKLHQEMAATMYQLHAIRDELRGGINLINPGPLTQRALKIKPLAGQQGMIDPWAEAAAQAGAAPWGSAAPAPAQSLPSGELLQREQASAVPPGGWAQQRHQQQQQHAASAGLPPAAAWQQQAAPASFASAPLLQSAPQLSAAASFAPGQPAAEGARATAGATEATARHPRQLPVSAVSAGLAPDRQGGVPTGAEVCVDALMEELIAQQALLFFQQQQQGQQQERGQQENLNKVAGQSAAPGATATDAPSPEQHLDQKHEHMEQTAAACEPLRAAAQATTLSAPAQSPKRRGRPRKQAAQAMSPHNG